MKLDLSKKPMHFFIILVLIILPLLFSGCSLLSGNKVSENTGSESAQIEETIISKEDEKSQEELIKEDERLKEEALEKEKKDRELMEKESSDNAAYAAADSIKPEGSCDLVIITPSEFVSLLVPLKEHKNNTGIVTKIISLEDIYSNYEGRDEAEKVKYFLADYKKSSNIKYAMLVGDSDKFPIRFTKTDRETAAAFNTAYYGADLYYADLYKSDGSFDDWDNNKNGFFGELAGESSTGLLNVDEVDLTPDIAVGRIPASTADEVSIYVAKAIAYENDNSKSVYINNILLISTQDPSLSALFCADQDQVAGELLKNRNVTKLYDLDKEFFDSSWSEKYTPEEYDKIIAGKLSVNVGIINSYLDKGIGFLSYMGHGNKDVWANIYATEHVSSLKNSKMLTVIFTGGCGTAEFATLPPYSAYLDINGVYHQGTNNGEVFTQTPPQPACIQQENNPESLAEFFTVYYDVGAVGYFGFITGAQGGFNSTLNYSFFEAIKNGEPAIGDIWAYMTEEYYKVQSFPETISTPDWVQVAGFHQPWKLFLFGDPSLRINTVK
jgi:hypothetical protein